MTEARPQRLHDPLEVHVFGFFRRRLHGTYEEPIVPTSVTVRRIELTPEEIRAGQQSWLRLNAETGLLESVVWFPESAYTAALPPGLSRAVQAWSEHALDALTPLISEDVERTSTNTKERSTA